MLTSCSGQGGGEGWFPLIEGERMVYAVTVESDEAPPPEAWTLTVTAPQTVAGQRTQVRHHSAGVSYHLLTVKLVPGDGWMLLASLLWAWYS
ncbi:MAG: hypothetical protein ACT6UU_24025, partial [Hydrogenophaga sp.]|uniref:hypothetical protein n=1 Tax=Hydrogenophaga sp. TaxID=1904254 RepID=UPI0040359EAF